jgi:hypothetical protein
LGSDRGKLVRTGIVTVQKRKGIVVKKWWPYQGTATTTENGNGDGGRKQRRPTETVNDNSDNVKQALRSDRQDDGTEAVNQIERERQKGECDQ